MYEKSVTEFIVRNEVSGCEKENNPQDNWYLGKAVEIN